MNLQRARLPCYAIDFVCLCDVMDRLRAVFANGPLRIKYRLALLSRQKPPYDDGLMVVFSCTTVAPDSLAFSVIFATVSFMSWSGPFLLPCDLMMASDSVRARVVDKQIVQSVLACSTAVPPSRRGETRALLTGSDLTRLQEEEPGRQCSRTLLAG